VPNWVALAVISGQLGFQLHRLGTSPDRHGMQMAKWPLRTPRREPSAPLHTRTFPSPPAEASQVELSASSTRTTSSTFSHAVPADGDAAQLGYLLVETKRHTPSLAPVTAREGERLGLVLARVSRALRDSEHADLVVGFTLGDHTPHFHLHLAARYDAASPDGRSPVAPAGLIEVEAPCARLRTELDRYDWSHDRPSLCSGRLPDRRAVLSIDRCEPAGERSVQRHSYTEALAPPADLEAPASATSPPEPAQGHQADASGEQPGHDRGRPTPHQGEQSTGAASDLEHAEPEPEPGHPAYDRHVQSVLGQFESKSIDLKGFACQAEDGFHERCCGRAQPVVEPAEEPLGWRTPDLRSSAR
jgi:histidine triad (HIT) family protein